MMNTGIIMSRLTFFLIDFTEQSIRNYQIVPVGNVFTNSCGNVFVCFCLVIASDAVISKHAKRNKVPQSLVVAFIHHSLVWTVSKQESPSWFICRNQQQFQMFKRVGCTEWNEPVGKWKSNPRYLHCWLWFAQRGLTGL